MTPLIQSRDIVLDATGQGVVSLGGQVFCLDAATGATASIDVTWQVEGEDSGKVNGVTLGRIVHAGGDFTSARISGGAANDTLRILVGPEGAFVQSANSQSAVIGHVVVDSGNIEISNDVGNPLPVTGTPQNAAHTNAKKTAAAASALALAANANRKYLSMQNPSDTEYVYFRTDGGAAVADATSHKLYPGASYEPLVPPSGQINIIRGGAVNVDITVTEA